MRWPSGTQKATGFIWRLVVACFVFYVLCQLFGLLAAGMILVLKPAVAAVGPAFREPLVFGAIAILFVGVPSLLVCALARFRNRDGGAGQEEQRSEAAPGSDRA